MSGRATRDEINRHLFRELPGYMTSYQKKIFVKNLLQDMRKAGVVKASAVEKRATWSLTDYAVSVPDNQEGK